MARILSQFYINFKSHLRRIPWSNRLLVPNRLICVGTSKLRPHAYTRDVKIPYLTHSHFWRSHADRAIWHHWPIESRRMEEIIFINDFELSWYHCNLDLFRENREICWLKSIHLEGKLHPKPSSSQRNYRPDDCTKTDENFRIQREYWPWNRESRDSNPKIRLSVITWRSAKWLPKDRTRTLRTGNWIISLLEASVILTSEEFPVHDRTW
jgi:hypothetical protein